MVCRVVKCTLETRPMRDMAGMMMHHRTTAQNFAFSPKKPSLTRSFFTCSKRLLFEQLYYRKFTDTCGCNPYIVEQHMALAFS